MLALAVVAERGGLEDRRQADPVHRRGQLLERLHRLERRHREALQAQERLLARALLGDVQGVAAGPHRHDLGGGIGGGGGDVLELEGDDVHAAREGANGVEVVVVGVDFDVGHLAGGRVEAGRERVHAVTHPPGCDREHPSELSAAEHAERGAGKDDPVHGKLSSRTERGLRLAERPEARGQLGPCRGQDRHGEQAGVLGARLADGERRHRHTAGHLHDRQQRVEAVRARRSAPARRAPAAMVCAATIPGRWAAPPAPAMITFRPWPSAPCRELRHPRRGAMGRHDLLQVGHAELVEHGGRVRHRVPVGLRSHDHGDERCWHGGLARGSGQLIKCRDRGPGTGDQGPRGDRTRR